MATILIVDDEPFLIMDGLQIIKSFKANEKTKNIPVIMCTARDSVSDVDESFRLGAVGYIVKPFSLQRIRDKVDEILGDKKEEGVTANSPEGI